MGFLGSIRKTVVNSIRDGVYDVKKLSDELVTSAKRAVPTTDISNFFTTKFVKTVDNVPMLGNTKMLEFSQFAREGNFEGSFGKAFSGNAALRNPSVRSALDRLLLQARKELPDFKYSQNTDLLKRAKDAYKIDPKSLKSEADLAKAVDSSPQLKSNISRLLSASKTAGKVTFFGGAFVLASYTATELYKRAVEEAEKQSGCMAYWIDQNSGTVMKCKINAYSCRHAKGNKCLAGVVPKEILENADCSKDENKDKLCNHCEENDTLNANLPENITLKCEEKTAGEIIYESIGQTLGNVWSGVSNGLRNIFLYGAIFLIVVIVLVVIINFLR